MTTMETRRRTGESARDRVLAMHISQILFMDHNFKGGECIVPDGSVLS